MARGFKVRAEIAQPGEVVWAALTDPARMPLWMTAIDSAHIDGPAPLGPGTRIITNQSIRGRRGEREARVVAWEPERRFALSSSQGGLTAVYDYRCQAVGARSTQVTLEARCNAQGLLWRLLHPLIVVLMRRSDGDQLERLKRLLEAEA